MHPMACWKILHTVGGWKRQEYSARRESQAVLKLSTAEFGELCSAIPVPKHLMNEFSFLKDDGTRTWTWQHQIKVKCPQHQTFINVPMCTHKARKSSMRLKYVDVRTYSCPQPSWVSIWQTRHACPEGAFLNNVCVSDKPVLKSGTLHGLTKQLPLYKDGFKNTSQNGCWT